MCSVFLIYANGEQYDEDVNNGNNNNYYSNEKTENAIAPDEEISLEHIERLCIEKCPDQVGNEFFIIIIIKAANYVLSKRTRHIPHTNIYNTVLLYAVDHSLVPFGVTISSAQILFIVIIIFE